MEAAARRKAIARSQRALTNWTARHGEGEFELRCIEQLKSESCTPICDYMTISNLRVFANRQNILGQHALLHGEHGWPDILSAMKVECELADCNSRQIARLGRENVSPTNYSVFFGMEGQAALFAMARPKLGLMRGWYENLREYLSTTGGGSNGFYAHPLVILAAWLHSKLRGEAEPPFGSKVETALAFYAPITSAWENENALADFCLSALDYHLTEANKSNDSPTCFDQEAWMLFPIEFLAIVSVRAQLGLGVPSFEHPLLDLPQCRIPSEIVPVPPDFVSSVLVRCDLSNPNVYRPR